MPAYSIPLATSSLSRPRNGPRGAVEVYRVWANTSGLDYKAVTAPVRIWHGDADAVVPLHHAEFIA